RELIVTTAQQLQDSSEAAAEEEFQERSRELYELVFEPLVERLGKPRTLYVLPDSELQRVALETLVDRPGHYLIEDYQFAYLSSAGDLLRPALAPGKGTWVFAGPDYDLSAEERGNLVASLVTGRDRRSGDAPGEAAAPPAEVMIVERGGSWNRLPF